MAEQKRLGKRGAYRLGEMRFSGRPKSRGPVRHQPSFGSRRSRGAVWGWLAACAVTAAVLGLGAAFGLWWLPFAAGIAAGAAPWRARSAL
ncbi:MAG: hypothetical protein ACRDOB_25035, partial [Streptosporangiaceae bacterium]